MASTRARSAKHKPHLTTVQRELIVQTYAMCGNLTATAKEAGVHVSTVSRVVREAEADPEMAQARFRALTGLAGRAHAKAEAVLDSIAPSDLTTERIPVHNEDGDVCQVLEVGPSLRDKAFAFGQITDRVTALQQARYALTHASSPSQVGGDAGLLLPDTVEACRAMIAQKVARLRILDVEFAPAGATGARITDVRRKAGVAEPSLGSELAESSAAHSALGAEQGRDWFDA